MTTATSATHIGGLGSATDGVVAIRPSRASDQAVLVAGRDEVSRRFLGEGQPDPRPTACIVVADEVVGWVDFDVERTWLQPGEVNLGYQVFADHRGRGYATRAVRLLLHRLAVTTDHTTATLLIDAANDRSLALARRIGFDRAADLDDNAYWKLPIPPLTYTDGVVTIRRLGPDDLDMDLAAKDEEQIRWLWLPGQREGWEAMSAEQRRAHALRGLEEQEASFGTGPKWVFAVDTVATPYVAYLDCDLANDHVPAGEANISYSAHPDHRGRGHVSRGVRLALRFLRDHTGAREAHVLTDAENHASTRVADAVGAPLVESWIDDHGRTMLRHVLAL